MDTKCFRVQLFKPEITCLRSETHRENCFDEHPHSKKFTWKHNFPENSKIYISEIFTLNMRISKYLLRHF